MNKLFLAGCVIALSTGAFGATVSLCSAGPGSSGSFSLTTAGSADTYTCGDKSFSGFSLTAGSGSIFISEATADTYGITYSPSNEATSTGFTLAFNINVTSTDRIIQVSDQMFTNTALPNAAAVTVTHTPGGVVNLSASGSQTGFVNISTQSEGISAVYTPNGANSLRSIEFAFTEAPQSTVPEPMTLSLVGSGLIALGAIGRRKRKA